MINIIIIRYSSQTTTSIVDKNIDLIVRLLLYEQQFEYLPTLLGYYLESIIFTTIIILVW